jgi:hypothetical protein
VSSYFGQELRQGRDIGIGYDEIPPQHFVIIPVATLRRKREGDRSFYGWKRSFYRKLSKPPPPP